MAKQELQESAPNCKAWLSKLVDGGASSLPSGVNAERLKINAMMYVLQDEKLRIAAEKNPVKIAQIIYNFISLGLDILNRECYIIPYENYKTGITQLTILKDYKGEVKLAKKYSIDPIREIYARVVYAVDNYYFDNLGHFVHEFDPFLTERGEKKGAFCTIIYENGVQQSEFVNVDEIAKVRANSSSAKSPNSPWNTWPDEMWRKTVIKKAMKNISLDFGDNSADLTKAYRESENDLSFNTQEDEQPAKSAPLDYKVINQSDTLDGNFEDVPAMDFNHI